MGPRGRWKREGPMPLTTAIFGKRLGIVGLGRIGKAVALRTLPRGMEISYSDGLGRPA